MRKVTGLSLVEMLVALFIMSLSLAMIYRAVGGSARGISQIQESQGASMLAHSLLDTYRAIEPTGVQAQGQDGVYNWYVQSQPAMESNGLRLHRLDINIEWSAQRRMHFSTLRPEQQSQPRGLQ